MADIKLDLLGLKYSQNFSIAGLEEANIDLNLSPAAEIFSTLIGIVTDGQNPIPNATVKVFDSNGMPYKHTLTDENGNYTISELPAGTYSVGAVKDGYRLSNTQGVTLNNSDTIKIDLVCIADETLNLGAIAGILHLNNADGTKSPLGGVKITLNDTINTAIATTYTADDGEFAFYDVADGVYNLIATAEGYTADSVIAATITNGSISNVDMTMTVDSRTYSGTVSGIIRDDTSKVVSNCFVGLYKVTTLADGTKREVLVATTKTNQAGKYMFGEVGGGEYIVKAKMNR
ncbi:MAG TPA: carboxypeptidase regulatory-like domain-containing protein [Candidatus Butyricicoccus avistercoris]|uniref:Carboxypeptidase regulatory-like domain-containing protein n=1 Tax=Candidatus Butyricicoccus avistercoris TaxID=2838518 RepID=A0A9D1PJ86_9FIRM|nr:carboxypeptidase regulatory-like domain-containing protein [Candidatus Butyricicoccus avistercoris]